MSVHFRNSSRLLSQHIRLFSTQKNTNKHILVQESTVQKALDNAKTYIDKVNPLVQPYLDKMNNVTEQFKRLTHSQDSKEAIQRLGETLNEITGYNQIDAVKSKVKNQANLFEKTRDEVQEAKRAFEEAIDIRSTAQRDINELLQRKHLWTGDDVTKFTELYRLEHSYSKAEMLAKERYQNCEKQMDREYMELARSIMERYHEEQLWSDKIRSVSTYGTWALMAVNLLLFVAVQTVFEPHKRKRLTDRFEELLVTKVAEEEEKFKQVLDSLDEKDKLLMQQQIVLMETINTLTDHPLFNEETLETFKNQSNKPVELDTDSLRSLLLEIKPQEKIQEKPQEIPQEKLQEPPVIQDESKKLLMYSIESAIAGGLVTAIAFYFLQ